MKFQKLWLWENYGITFFCTPLAQSLDCSNKESKVMLVLSLFRSAVITEELQLLTKIHFLVFILQKFWTSMNFRNFYNNESIVS